MTEAIEMDGMGFKAFEGGVYDGEEFSRGEHEIMRSLYDMSIGGVEDGRANPYKAICKGRLRFDTEELDVAHGRRPLKYVNIPNDGTRRNLFKVLFPFYPFPDMDEEMVDIHSGRTFKFKDAMIIFEPWNGYNYLVSPYYAESGGMAVDMAPAKDIGIGGDEKHEDD